MCPKGDDPLTINQNYREINVTVSNSYSTSLSGTLGIEFEGRTSYISLSYPSNSNCISGLVASGSYGYIGCKLQEISSHTFLYTITIYSWPTFPVENNLFSHNGDPAITEFYCDVTKAVSGTTCVFQDVISTNIRGELLQHFSNF